MFKVVQVDEPYSPVFSTIFKKFLELMDKPNQQLTRVCASCGEKKPLSAFLQLGGAQGATYGSICNECRRKGISTQTSPVKKQEEGDSTASGFRIGAKQKAALDIEKQRQYQNIKEIYRKEFKKREQLQTDKLSKTEFIQKAEKDHRKFFIEAKKQGFLAGTKTPENKQVVLAERTREKMFVEAAQQDKTLTIEETKKKEDLFNHLLKLTTSDLNLQYLNPRYTELRYQGPLFLQFMQWLGSSAPIARNSILKSLTQIYNKDTAATLQKEFTNKGHREAQEGKKDVLLEYIDKTWGPSSRKR